MDGQLGNGTTEDSSTPICISELEGNALKEKKIVGVSSKEGTVIAKDSEGKVYAWGRNDYGQLGNGTTGESNPPICISELEGSVLKGKNIADVYCYGITTIAIDSEGKVYTWGRNDYGQLGNGTIGGYSSIPICISELEGNALKGKNIVDVASITGTIIARDSEGKMYAWGRNDYGQLGNGTTEDSSMPICITELEGNVLKGKNIVDIDDALILKDSEGKVYAWGQSGPICINELEGNALKGKNIVDVASITGTIIARDSEGKIYTWGNNGHGQLGDGSTQDSNIPICISDIQDSEIYNQVIKKMVCKGTGGERYIIYIGENNAYAKIYTVLQ